MASKPWIPDEAFTALSLIIPALARLVDRSCGISLGGWLILSEILRRGEPSPDGPVMLRSDLTKLFDERGFSRPNVSKLLDTLFEKQLIDRPRLTAPEREEIFGQEGGHLAVVLTTAGRDKIEELKTVLREAFDEWRSKQSAAVRLELKAFRGPAINFARVFLNRK